MQDAFPVDNRHLRLDADAAQPLDWRAICDDLRQRGREGRRGAAEIRQQTQGAAVAAELGLGASAAADDNAVRPKLLPIRRERRPAIIFTLQCRDGYARHHPHMQGGQLQAERIQHT